MNFTNKVMNIAKYIDKSILFGYYYHIVNEKHQ